MSPKMPFFVHLHVRLRYYLYNFILTSNKLSSKVCSGMLVVFFYVFDQPVLCLDGKVSCVVVTLVVWCDFLGSDRLSDISSLSDHLASPHTHTLTDLSGDQATSSHRLKPPSLYNQL